MTAPQTTIGSTDTFPRVFEPAAALTVALLGGAGVLAVASPHDPRRSTTTGAVEFWQRVSVPAAQSVEAIDLFSSADMQQPSRLPLPAFFSLVLQGTAQPVVTSAEPLPAADLSAAMRDLEDATEEAQAEDFPQPSRLALKNAERLLRDLYRLRPSRLEVYPTPDGEIALVLPGGQGRSVLVLCSSHGNILCSVNLNGQHRRASYSTATMLPDGFIREALEDLDEPDPAS